jgi:hypothetical protein
MSTAAAILPAGRELDALVLAQVFGFKWDETRCRACGGHIVPHPEYPGCWADNCSMRPIPKGDERADAIAKYSTEDGAALIVVKQMIALLDKDRTAEKGWPSHRVELVYDIVLGGWSANFGGLPVHGATFADAICRAALAMMPALNRQAAGGGA